MRGYVDFRNILTYDLQNDTVPRKLPIARIDSSGQIHLDSTEGPLIATDSLSQITDTTPIVRTDTFNIRYSKDSLEGPLKYGAVDSLVFDVKKSQIFMYGKASAEYKTTKLDADRIMVDQPTNMVIATFSTDTSGNPIGIPKMVDGETPMTSDSIIFNFKTQRGLTKTTYTQQGEMFVSGEVIKKINENEYFASKALVTTCNYDHPHFAFKAGKMKMVNKKLAVTGAIHPEFEGVPVPIYLPFGLFPLSSGGRHSGLLAPTFATNEQFGIGLEGLGYYKVINDHVDMTFLSSIYSYGGWNFSVQSDYRTRYRFNGGVTFRMQNTKMNFKGDPDFFKSKTFNINWSHTVDGKARPGQSFSASVNAGSTRFNQLTPNNPYLNFQNQLNSSISYSKNWDGKVNLTVNANHNQNNNQRLINLNLPDVGFTVSTLYPFQRQEMVGKPRWYEKFGIGLNSSFRNQISFYDSAFSWKQLLDTARNGFQHTVPLTLSLPQVGPLQIAPSITYEEKWYSQEMLRNWNPLKNDGLGGIDTTINKGFYTARQMSFGIGFNTALFGTKSFRNSRVQAIRHVIRPSVGVSYRPDFQKRNYDSIQVDQSGRKLRMSRFDGSLFGPISEGTFGGMSFGLDNNLEMKVRAKNDTSEDGVKKVRLIDGFGLNGSYNFMADQFKLSTISMYMRSTLFEKINFTANSSLDPYQVDEKGYRIDKYAWEGKKFSLGSLGRITNGSIALSTRFASKPKDDAKARADSARTAEELGPLTLEEQQMQLDYARQNAAEFTDFNIPWSVNVSFSLNFQRMLKRDYSGYETVINSALNLGGDFNLTPKWKAGANGYYDIRTLKLESFTMFISREMHCWQMSINITPVGLYRYFSIVISPRSGLLRDLKVNRTRYFYTNPGF